MARFYDIIYQNLRDGVDHRFFQKHIQRTRGKVLEIGAGTGRFFTEALQNGADIYGIDISEHMLEVLREKLPEKAHHRVSNQSATDFAFDMQFELIVAPFRVMMHLLDKDEQLQALQNIHNHLKPGGTFIFDAFIPALERLQQSVPLQTDFEGEYAPGQMLRRKAASTPDYLNQLIKVHFQLEWEEEGGRMKQKDWHFPLRFFFRYELEHLLDRSPFSSYTLYGDYEEHPLSRKSTDFVVICRA